MYEEIRPAKKKPKSNLPLWAAATLCVTFISLVTALLVGGYLYYTGFREYVNDFSKATSLSYRKGSVMVTTAEEEFDMSGNNIYYVYNLIINAGRGRPRRVPETEPDAVLEYSFGGKLELWEVKLGGKNSVREYGLLICFTNPEGKTYCYDTDRITLSRLPLEFQIKKPISEEKTE